jgi:hypothetical protein
MGNPAIPNTVAIMQKSIYFLFVHTQSLLNESLSRVYNTSIQIKMSEMDSKPLKTLAKPYKYPLNLEKKRGRERR